MFCVNCGAKFEGKFCPECGTKAATESDFQKAAGAFTTEEVKELPYLRDARDCLLALSNEYTKILIEDIKAVQVKKEIEFLTSKRAVISEEIQTLEKEYQERLNAIDEEGNKQKISVGKAALGVYTCGLSLLATGIHKKKNIAGIEAAKSFNQDWFEREVNPKKEEVESLTNKANSLEDRFLEEYNKNIAIIKTQVKSILDSEKWLIAKSNIPSNYLNIDAIPRLIELLTYGRATSWREACNFYEDELFKLRMIDIGERQLLMQEDILEAQKDLIELTMESINLQHISLELQQAGLILQEQLLETQKNFTANTEILVKEAIKLNGAHQIMLKEMNKIRKNTGCTKRAAQISAFTDFNDMFFGRKVKIK